MRSLKDLVRPNIWDLKPYSCARDEYKGRQAKVFLDANENPYNNPYNRYPDPLQTELKQKLSSIKGVKAEGIFLGNGSDEAIDLVYRVFCVPNQDNVVAIQPTYGMYEVCADINDVEYRTVPLNTDFSLNTDRLLAATDEHTKVIWLCSPNNPTGNSMKHEALLQVLQGFEGIVVVDEAYGEFSMQQSTRFLIDSYPRLLVLNTFSKAWGCASIRLGMAFAQPDIIEMFNKVKYPYNVNKLTQDMAMDMLGRQSDVHNWIKLILEERPKVMTSVSELRYCEKVYPTDANFFLAKMKDATNVYQYLIDNGVIVRNRSQVALCDDCLRITVGSPSENNLLLSALRKYQQ